MPNLITRYTNGTFEGAKATWDSNLNETQFQAITQSGDFAFDGVSSCKFELKNVIGGLAFGVGTYLTSFIITPGSSMEAKLRVRCTADVPDDYYFVLVGIPDLGKERIIKVVQAIECKTDWALMQVNEYSLTYTEGPDQVSALQFYIVKDMASFLAYTDYAEWYPELNILSNSNAAFPVGAFVYIDGMTTEEKAIPLVIDDQLAGRKLYHVKNVFFLSDGTNLYDIHEPIGWDKILLHVEFDMSSFRYKFEFTDKDVVLKFDLAAGYAILQNLWDTKGPDAVASLKFGELSEDNVLTIHYEAELNFAESYGDDKYVVEMTAEKRSFSETFRTRFDVEVDLLKNITLDGRALAALTKQKLWLLPTVKNESTTFKGNPNAPDFGNLFDGSSDAVPPFQIVLNSIDGINAPFEPDGNFYYSGSKFKDGVKEKRLIISLKVRFTTSYTNNLTARAEVWLYKVSQISQSVQISPNFSISETNRLYKYVEALPMLAGTSDIVAEIGPVGFTLLPDEALYIKCVSLIFGGGTNDNPSAWVAPASWFMNVDYKEVYTPTLVDSFQIHEAVNRQLEMITDTPNVLKSNFFGRVDLGYAADGCGSQNLVTNGLLIRQITKKFALSAKTWFNSLSALYCLGMSVEKNANGSLEWLRVEPLEFFFQNIETLRLTNISNYHRETATEFMFNELEFGYGKFPNDNQRGSLNEFMTKMSYLNPFKALKNKLSKVCDFILSTTYFDLTRRENVKDNPTGNFETDEDVFMTGHQGALSSVFLGTDIQFIAATKEIIISRWDIPVAEGDLIIIGSTANNNGVKTVTSINVSYEFNRITLIVSNALVDETVAFTDITFATPRFIPETDEQFAAISGIDPVPVYFSDDRYPYLNLRHHVKRMFLRWSKFFTTGLRSGTAIQFTTGKNNTALQTQLNDDADCLGMDGRSAALFVRDDGASGYSEVIQYPLSKPLFGKNKISFDAQMTWDTFNAFRKAFEGRHPQNKNYGYISFLNPKGEGEKGFCLSARFNPVTQTCKFITIEKKA